MLVRQRHFLMKEELFKLINDDDDVEEQYSESESWERYPNESAKAYEAFCVYRDIGPTRSLAKTAEAMNHPPGYKQTLWKWSTKYEWQSRCYDYDDHMERVARLEKENMVREMTNRHACDAIKIQQIAMEALERISLEAAPPRDLIRVWEKAVRAERASRGLPPEPADHVS